MANLFGSVLLISSLFFFISPSSSQQPFWPKAAIFPVAKDLSTLQYVTQIYKGAELAPVKLVMDIGGQFLWVHSPSTHFSSSQNLVESNSLRCSMANPTTDSESSFNGGLCTLLPKNTITDFAASGELAEDVVALELADELSNTGLVSSSNRFLFSNAPKVLLTGLASGTQGMLGLGNSRISLPSQLASSGFLRKFALCLSSTNGALISGEGPYVSLLGNDISKTMMYTPLISNHGGKSEEYYINVRSIRISGKKLCLNSSDGEGLGGAKISTIAPYTMLESRTYDTFVKAYEKIAMSMNMIKVAPVAPFGLCFSSSGADPKRVVQNVPIIALVLQSEVVKWRIYGRNSLVQVGENLMCLGFLDGGVSQRPSMIIGGYQLEETLLEFNLGTSMLGFTSLLMGEKRCSDIKLNSVLKDIL